MRRNIEIVDSFYGRQTVCPSCVSLWKWKRKIGSNSDERTDKTMVPPPPPPTSQPPAPHSPVQIHFISTNLRCAVLEHVKLRIKCINSFRSREYPLPFDPPVFLSLAWHSLWLPYSPYSQRPTFYTFVLIKIIIIIRWVCPGPRSRSRSLFCMTILFAMQIFQMRNPNAYAECIRRIYIAWLQLFCRYLVVDSIPHRHVRINNLHDAVVSFIRSFVRYANERAKSPQFQCVRACDRKNYENCGGDNAIASTTKHGPEIERARDTHKDEKQTGIQEN